jgi:RNA polymerase sigma-70 factor, ECF subfamily
VALLQEEFTGLCDDVDLDRDRDLVERCQAGDSGAFGNLYARYYERLLRFCLRRLNDRHEAEDAAQEAFARAWKALPNFAGERRFYPWLTVIAGNICTDMLRRRSRSTPTDDMELSAQQHVGGGGNETSEELVLAAVDGELVNKALDRLSVRHRHVLAMREGSGWTYQQIADHEGVEIGTIETLLWRARQALKREFTVLSESKGMLGGFLAGAGALLRRGMFRAAHRGSALQQAGGSGGGLRNALTGVAFTSAAVAAAFITPHAFSGSGSTGSALAGAATPNIASPASLVENLTSSSGQTNAGNTALAGGATALGSKSSGGGTASNGSSKGSQSIGGKASGATGSVAGIVPTSVPGVTTTTLPSLPGQILPGGLGGGVTGTVTKTVTSAVGGLAGTVTSTASSLGSGLVGTLLGSTGLGGLTGSGSSNSGTTSTTTTTTLPVVGPVVKSVTAPLKNILGGL